MKSFFMIHSSILVKDFYSNADKVGDGLSFESVVF